MLALLCLAHKTDHLRMYVSLCTSLSQPSSVFVKVLGTSVSCAAGLSVERIDPSVNDLS